MKIVFAVRDSGPLSMRARRETAGAETRTYIPGATVLGALAAVHAQQCSDAAEFDAFFGAASRFSNLYPATFEDEDLHRTNKAPVYPLPSTAVTCKRFSGFRYDQDPDSDPHHGVYDTAVAATLFALSGETRLDVLARYDRCGDPSGCREPMDRFDGYYRRDIFDAAVVGSVRVRRGLRTRTGISRLTGAVEQSILYSREVLNAGTVYWGTAVVPDQHAARFTAFLRAAGETGLLRFGNNRTRGFGSAAVTVETPAPETVDSADSLVKRMAAFDATVRQGAQAAGIAAEHDLYVSVTLTADAILPDRLLRYQSCIDGAYLAAVWGIPGAQLLFQSGGVRRVMGWNQMLGTPKADDTAITLGSVFVFGLDRPLDRALAEKFLTMQEQSIGVRRSEGFGQVLVASPFHYEARGL